MTSSAVAIGMRVEKPCDKPIDGLEVDHAQAASGAEMVAGIDLPTTSASTHHT